MDKSEGCIRIITKLQQDDDPVPACKNGQIVLNTPDLEGCYSSDHFGVRVDINLSATS